MVRAQSDGPFTYEIRVYGRMNASWSGRVNEMTITTGECETWLTGQLADQAALIGVLTTLYDWGYALISVRQTESVKPDAYCECTD